MSLRRRAEPGVSGGLTAAVDDLEPAANGFTGFLRRLLKGIPWSERAESTDEIVFQPANGAGLRLYNPRGRTRVCGEDRSDIRVRVHKRARAESQDAADQLLDEIQLLSHETSNAVELEVDVPKRWNRRGHAHLEIFVPRGTHVEVQAINGRIDIEGIHASVNARSSNGSASLVDVVGNVEVTTSNAKVSCRCTCGRLTVRSSNGKIVLDEHRGSIDASTSNGLITASLDEVGHDGIQLATSNGRIALKLPEAVNADVDIRVDNGVIRNDCPRFLCERKTDGRVRGQLGTGGAPIRLRTSNGSISLR